MLTEVLNNLQPYLTAQELVEFFTSQPSETGEELRFPYIRLDKLTMIIKESIPLVSNRSQFKRLSRYMEKLLLWVYGGFQGDIGKLAEHPSSYQNWTEGVGLKAKEDEIIAYIKNNLPSSIQQIMQKYIQL